MQQDNTHTNQVTPAGNGQENQPVIITDLLANLCLELAQLFSTISRVTHTCLGLKEHLVTPTASTPFDGRPLHRKASPNDGNKSVGNPKQ